jgi:hypothetical protein
MALVPSKRYHGVVTTDDPANKSETKTNELVPVHPRHGDPGRVAHFGDFWTLGEGSAEKNNGKLDDRHTLGLSPYDMTPASDPRIPSCYNNVRYMAWRFTNHSVIGSTPRVEWENGADKGQGIQRITAMRNYWLSNTVLLLVGPSDELFVNREIFSEIEINDLPLPEPLWA